jgi:hypothetical protein
MISRCCLLDNSSGFEFLQANITAGPSNKTWESGDVINKVLTLIKKKITAITVICSMAYGQSQAMSKHVFCYSLEKPGINVNLVDPSNIKEYVTLLYIRNCKTN